MMISTIFLVAVMAIGFYLLYIGGYLPVSMKRAAIFVGSMRGDRASFQSCTGSIRRIVRFRKDGVVDIWLDAKLTKGGLSVEVRDAKREALAKLDSLHSSVSINVRAKARCTVIIRFENASGNYLLSWNERG